MGLVVVRQPSRSQPGLEGSGQPSTAGGRPSSEFLGTVPLPPVWCGPAWDADVRVHEIVIRF